MCNKAITGRMDNPTMLYMGTLLVENKSMCNEVKIKLLDEVIFSLMVEKRRMEGKQPITVD